MIPLALDALTSARTDVGDPAGRLKAAGMVLHWSRFPRRNQPCRPDVAGYDFDQGNQAQGRGEHRKALFWARSVMRGAAEMLQAAGGNDDGEVEGVGPSDAEPGPRELGGVDRASKE